ncbi:MAG: putative histidine kinase [Candidatus Saganbacteria bacterium]|uniref:histidine kinase n=1 Tax=Candidatus Saganbacteria bacterium TaxID=2575572 RepID=A0A833NYC8_UNCSA|nr:MAG: putative histidine kinase [Candidatus Saganbacteria bacterium]
MNYFAVPPLLTGILILFIGLFVFLNNRKFVTNIVFSCFCVSMSIWLVSFALMYYFNDNPVLALKWARFGFIGIIFIPIFAYHFINTFINSRQPKWVMPSLYILGSFFVSLSQSNYIYSGVNKYFWGYYPVAGHFYLIYLIMFVLLFTYGIFLLYKNWEKYKKEKNNLLAQQTAYVLVAFLGGTTSLVDFIVKYQIPMYPFGYFSALLFISFIAYAILQFRLMDIEIIIKKTAVYSILTAFITVVFLLVIFISNYLALNVSGNNSIWIGLAAALIIAFIINPLRNNVQKYVDRLFFRERYDYQNILRKYSRVLTKPISDLNRFSIITPYLIAKSLKLSGSSFMVHDRESRRYVIRGGIGEVKELIGFSMPEDSDLITEIFDKRSEINLEEIDYLLASSQNLTTERKNRLLSIKKQMVLIHAELIIPCISDSAYFNKPTLLSTINLGRKHSDAPYSGEDIEFLKTLASQVAINIEYAFIFEELKRNQEKLLHSEKLAAIGSTTAGVAHELKNPLTYLNTLSQILPEKWDDPKFRDMVSQTLPSEIQRMQLIVGGLLDYSKTQKFQPSPTDIKQVIEKTIAVMGYEMKKHSTVLKTTYNHSKTLNADPNRLLQVFMNLISNAIQAMPEGKSGEILIKTEDSPNGITIIVSDNGAGISQEKLLRIFDPFFTTKEQGNGIGLAITKKIIDEHKGSISVESKVNEGTKFTILLPS